MQPGAVARVISARGTIDTGRNGSFRVASDCSVQFRFTLPAGNGQTTGASDLTMRGFLAGGGKEILAFQTDPGAMVAARFISEGK